MYCYRWTKLYVEDEHTRFVGKEIINTGVLPLTLPNLQFFDIVEENMPRMDTNSKKLEISYERHSIEVRGSQGTVIPII